MKSQEFRFTHGIMPSCMCRTSNESTCFGRTSSRSIFLKSFRINSSSGKLVLNDTWSSFNPENDERYNIVSSVMAPPFITFDSLILLTRKLVQIPCARCSELAKSVNDDNLVKCGIVTWSRVASAELIKRCSSCRGHLTEIFVNSSLSLGQGKSTGWKLVANSRHLSCGLFLTAMAIWGKVIELILKTDKLERSEKRASGT